jgi:hypothetical protein
LLCPAAVSAGRDGWRQLMRHVVLQFWLSLDGYSCDEDTEPYRLMEEIEDPEQEEYFVGRLRQAGTHMVLLKASDRTCSSATTARSVSRAACSSVLTAPCSRRIASR